MNLLVSILLWIGIGCVVGRGMSLGFVDMRLLRWVKWGLVACVVSGLVCAVRGYQQGLCAACLVTGLTLPVTVTLLRLKRRLPPNFGNPVVRRRARTDGTTYLVSESTPLVYGNMQHGWLLVYPGTGSGNNMRYSLSGKPLFDEPDEPAFPAGRIM